MFFVDSQSNLGHGNEIWLRSGEKTQNKTTAISQKEEKKLVEREIRPGFDQHL